MSNSVTPTSLFCNPENLLVKKGDSSTVLKSFEGKVGAIIQNGRYFITSPNMTRVYAVPSNDGISIRVDLRLGDDDPLQWPQPYISSFIHYAAIPLPPAKLDPGHFPYILYHTLQDRDFVPLDDGAVSGLGHLSFLNLKMLKEAVTTLRAELDDYRRDSSNSDILPIFSTLLVVIERSLRCLEGVPMNRRQTMFIFAETQRYMLEFMAAYRYQYVYRPRMNDNTTQPPVKPAYVVGAFTRELRVADDFFRAGIPVWLVRPASFAGTVRVDSIVPLTYPRDINLKLDRDTQHFPVTFRGSYGDPQKYKAFAQYSLSFLSYPDPFNSIPPTSSNIEPSLTPGLSVRSGLLARTSGSVGVVRTAPTDRRGPTPYRTRDNKQLKNSNRNKFLPSMNPLVPPPLPVWSTALLNVDQTGPTMSLSSDTAYIFPEPDLLVSPVSEDKKARYIFNWLQYRSALMHRLVSSASQAKPIHSQMWRTLLNLPVDRNLDDMTGTGSSSSLQIGKSKDRTSFVCELLQGCFNRADNVLPNLRTLGEAQWKGKFVTASSLPAPTIVREIVWEISEVNFRFEFVALDRRAQVLGLSSTYVSFEDRRELISRCFPGKGWSMVAVEWADACNGIGASQWQDRAPFVLAMRDVMKSWKGYEAATFEIEKELGNPSAQEFAAIETAVASFYTESFRYFFGRAAVLPRSLS